MIKTQQLMNNKDDKEMNTVQKTPVNLTNNFYNRAKFCFALGKEYFDSNSFYNHYSSYGYYNGSNIKDQISQETLKTAIQFINKFKSNNKDVLPLCKMSANKFIMIIGDKKIIISNNTITEA